MSVNTNDNTTKSSTTSGTTSGTTPSTTSSTTPTVVVESNLPNYVKLMVLISPFFMVSLLVVLSIINSDIKGFVYLAGVLFLFLICYGVQSLLKGNTHEKSCSLWNISLFKFPSFISALYTFTITYMLYPMITNQTFNFPLIVIFLIIYISDVVIRKVMGCSDYIMFIFGSAIGVLYAFMFITIIGQSPNPENLLYYNDFVSNKLACSVPSQQQFKCNFVQKGQIFGNVK